MPETATTTPEEPRLDLWLAAERSVTRTAAHTLIEAGLVTVNGRPARAGHRVKPRDVIVVTPPDVPGPAAPVGGPAVSLDVVYEDEQLAVINKPAGMVVHPALGHPHSTLADGLRQRGTTWSLMGGEERPGIVHRLDRDTSGLLVVAKTEGAHRALAAQLLDRSLGRTYWALVHGKFTEDTGTIEAPIKRDPRHRQRMAVVTGGRQSITDFTVVERCAGAARLDVDLRTGRTHQIRVHLAYIDHPVVGDTVYGLRSEKAAPRLALHARRLRFLHPADGEPRSFEAPVPDDLEAMLEAAREDGP